MRERQFNRYAEEGIGKRRREVKKNFFFSLSVAPARFRVMASLYGDSRSHSLDRPHSARLLWTSDQPDAQTPPNLTTHNIHKNNAPGGIRTHNPQQAGGRTPAPYTARLMGWTTEAISHRKSIRHNMRLQNYCRH